MANKTDLILLPSNDGADYDLYFVPRKGATMAGFRRVYARWLDGDYGENAGTLSKELKKVGWSDAKVYVAEVWDD